MRLMQLMVCNFFTALQRAAGSRKEQLIFARVQCSFTFTVVLKYLYLNYELQDQLVLS